MACHRIAAVLPGREKPVQERLYEQHSERQEKLLMSRLAADSDERTPAISETCACHERLAAPPPPGDVRYRSGGRDTPSDRRHACFAGSSTRALSSS